MTSFYGSTQQPKDIFGTGELLEAFFATMAAECPAAWELNEFFLSIWNDKATEYRWVLPDNFHAGFKVMRSFTSTVTFADAVHDVRFTENAPVKRGRALSANFTHSIDGMVVREMARRCVYDPKMPERLHLINQLKVRGTSVRTEEDRQVQTLWTNYKESGYLSARILEILTPENAGHVDMVIIMQLLSTLPKKPFNLITIHDAFRCHPNYANDMRRQYNQILSDLARSNILSFVLSQIMGKVVQVGKMDDNLWVDILEANYALT